MSKGKAMPTGAALNRRGYLLSLHNALFPQRRNHSLNKSHSTKQFTKDGRQNTCAQGERRPNTGAPPNARIGRRRGRGKRAFPCEGCAGSGVRWAEIYEGARAALMELCLWRPSLINWYLA
ncbi:unnamed protein product [Pieris brassicae]|uniref:Uncharacterized protein n=1 Tax=Pieris brassicae TaxID=7116 RepID=A0A9P0WVP9_PIEBR|nr:unnamed protein product [Pieris brassicae]